jgi:murein DD-endopeptidase MepM/ murein hydrolase activator NlpD
MEDGASPTPTASSTPGAPLEVTAELSSTEATTGSLVLVTVRLPQAAQGQKNLVIGNFEQTELPFYQATGIGPGVYQSVLGIPYTHEEGEFEVTVRTGEIPKPISLKIKIKEGSFPSEKLHVSPRKVNPKRRDMIRINREQKIINKVYTALIEKKYWNGPFQMPINSKVTSKFGTKRVYNGEMKNFHGGLDLKAKIGTPIRAAAAGQIVLAMNLFFTGNTVFIDHGYGVITLYAHMSKIKVKKGQIVKAGQLLGLSGKTGRVNGPHLHWQAMIHHVKVNPLELTRVME